MRSMGKSTSSSVRRSPTGSQSLRTVGARGSSSSAKPRIIYTCSPKVYKIEPVEFLDLVQKLTGRGSDSAMDSESQDKASSATGSMLTKLRRSQDILSVEDIASSQPLQGSGSGDHDADHSSSQLLASLPSPRFVTMNFLPMLAASSPIRAYNPSRRDVGFSLPSAAY